MRKWPLQTAVLLVCVLLAYVIWAYYQLPSARELIQHSRRVSLVIESNGAGQLQCVDVSAPLPVSLDDVPEALVNLLLFKEDRRFYWHPGFDPIGITRAGVNSVRTGGITEGGSTLTQQLAKNLYFSNRRSFRRKVNEIILSVKLTLSLTKAEVLELYLNTAPWGPNTYGVEVASRHYFRKSAQHLNLYESALLVSMLVAPSRLAWDRHPQRAQAAAEQLLRRAAAAGVVEEQAVQNALRRGVTRGDRPVQRPEHRWLYDYIQDDLRTMLKGKRGTFTVVTTLSPEAQIYADATVRNQRLGSNMQSAFVVLSLNGQVLAMVGGRNYRDSQFNRATRAQRQLGSTFKLFVYLAALSNGHQPHDPLEDRPVRPGWPRNHDGVYHGRVSLVDAFAHSMNAAAVNLARGVGNDNVAAAALQLGLPLSSPLADDAALGLTEASLLDITNAYACVGNGGYRVQPSGILAIRRRSVSVKPYTRVTPLESERVISPQAQEHLDMLLRHVVTRGTGKEASVRNVRVAGKTGTTRRDAWFIAYTPDFCAGIWIGPDYGSSTARGAIKPTVLFRNFAAAIYEYNGIEALRKQI